VVEQYSYSPYGADPTDPRKGVARITDADENELTPDDSVAQVLYTGRQFDKTIGLNYHRARQLSHNLGRWTRRDPLGTGACDLWSGNTSVAACPDPKFMFPTRPNLYEYVSSRPAHSVDPQGLVGMSVDHPPPPVGDPPMGWVPPHQRPPQTPSRTPPRTPPGSPIRNVLVQQALSQLVGILHSWVGSNVINGFQGVVHARDIRAWCAVRGPVSARVQGNRSRRGTIQKTVHVKAPDNVLEQILSGMGPLPVDFDYEARAIMDFTINCRSYAVVYAIHQGASAHTSYAGASASKTIRGLPIDTGQWMSPDWICECCKP